MFFQAATVFIMVDLAAAPTANTCPTQKGIHFHQHIRAARAPLEITSPMQTTTTSLVHVLSPTASPPTPATTADAALTTAPPSPACSARHPLIPVEKRHHVPRRTEFQ